MGMRKLIKILKKNLKIPSIGKVTVTSFLSSKSSYKYKIEPFLRLRARITFITPGHRRGNAEMVLATNLKRGGSHEEGVRQQLIKVLWAKCSPPPRPKSETWPAFSA
jgi:hypothetical protein